MKMDAQKKIKNIKTGKNTKPKNYKHLDGFFALQDGKECYWQAWIADSSFKRNFVIQHGLGEHSGRYRNILTAFLG